MAKNLYSLGLLRNGKVYQNKEQAEQALIQTSTNDGVAKLSRYLYRHENSNESIIRTLVGFYANADEMENAGGGKSYYTILDIEGSTAEVEEIKQEITEINNIIGSGITTETLTEAINSINDKIGNGFDENYTVADALELLAETLTDALTISLETAETPSLGCSVTYILSQGVGTRKTEVGKIDIPNDKVVSGASIVHGYWDGDTFTENEEGPDIAIKIAFTNADTIYVNAKDLIDVYTSGNGITVNNNVITAVAAEYSAENVINPIIVDGDGIKFTSNLDCGYFDD